MGSRGPAGYFKQHGFSLAWDSCRPHTYHASGVESKGYQVDCVGLHPWIGSCCPGRLLFERWADPNQQEPLVPLLHLCHGRHGLLPSHTPLSRDRRLQVLGWCSFALSWNVSVVLATVHSESCGVACNEHVGLRPL